MCWFHGFQELPPVPASRIHDSHRKQSGAVQLCLPYRLLPTKADWQLLVQTFVYAEQPPYASDVSLHRSATVLC